MPNERGVVHRVTKGHRPVAFLSQVLKQPVTRRAFGHAERRDLELARPHARHLKTPKCLDAQRRLRACLIAREGTADLLELLVRGDDGTDGRHDLLALLTKREVHNSTDERAHLPERTGEVPAKPRTDSLRATNHVGDAGPLDPAVAVAMDVPPRAKIADLVHHALDILASHGTGEELFALRVIDLCPVGTQINVHHPEATDGTRNHSQRTPGTDHQLAPCVVCTPESASHPRRDLHPTMDDGAVKIKQKKPDAARASGRSWYPCGMRSFLTTRQSRCRRGPRERRGQPARRRRRTRSQRWCRSRGRQPGSS